MSADKRSVKTDALETLGMIITEKEKRDAIHLAVDNVVAAQTLMPGEDVGFMEDGTVGVCDNPIGIVDPFLTAMVKKGQRFWLVVYPRQITSLRHVWTHPEFPEYDPATPDKKDKEASEKWLREFCQTADCPGYDAVMAAVTGKSISNEYGDGYATMDDEYLHFSGSDAHGQIPPEFWDHVEIVTDRKIINRPKYFSCSC